MTEVTVSARIPKDLQREIEKIMREEHLERSAALRKLLHMGLENYRISRALRGLAEGRFSLSKAAEEAHLTIWELVEEARRRQVVWVDNSSMGDIRNAGR